MPLTITQEFRVNLHGGGGGIGVGGYDVTYDSSYPTGGEAVASPIGTAPGEFPANVCHACVLGGHAAAGGLGRLPVGLNVATVSGLTFGVLQDAGAAGPMAEVPGGTDLSALRIKAVVIGR